jgi:hypothetical protein
MANDRIKVAGYAQKTQYNGGVEYRNFSPDLVGLQLTSDGGTPLFTMGNFSVTTNFEPKKTKKFITNNFSNFISLTDLDLTLEDSISLLSNNAGVFLNLDKTNLTNYTLFGSLTEFMRVSLEEIITNWPAALYVNPIYAIEPYYITQTGATIENYSYDSITNTSIFRVNTNLITNKYEINYLANGNTNTLNDLRNLQQYYEQYSILYNGGEYDVIGFTGSTEISNDYLYFTVNGNVFSGLTANDYPTFYVKPNSTKVNTFFNELSDFEAYLLNRQVYPLYTATFNYAIKTDNGGLLYTSEKVTWPTTDGYNIDFDTDEYSIYAGKLLNMATNFDLTTSNLVVRFLVTESITDFDTTSVHLDPLDQDATDQKVNKTLTIYGREFDNINSFITGIKFANVVSYDKSNNTPDIYLKNIARVLGWDLISSVLENNLLKSYLEPKESTFSGQTVGLTPIEADIELWRRIILNTPWIWKSKGTRKAIEFLFKFIGTPLGLISFNEYIYLAENKIDVDIFKQILELNGRPTELSSYPISISGYPQPFVNTPNVYFQSKGLWYRETGGESATIDITSGNNPHVGPYDGGYTYINQFKTLIPDFSAVTISSETTTTNTSNLFSNYNSGTMTGYSGRTYVDITNKSGVDFSDCYIVTSKIIEDPKHRKEETDCGCQGPNTLNSLSVCVEKRGVKINDCNSEIADVSIVEPENYYVFNYYQYNIDGTIYSINGVPVYYSSMFVDKACCNFRGAIPYYYNQVDTNTRLINSGYICCYATNTCGCLVTCKWNLSKSRWVEIPIGGNKYLNFVDELGERRVVSKDGCNCIKDYTIPVSVIDPYTNETGFGCQLTNLGWTDINLQDSVIVRTYNERVAGTIGCSDISIETKPKIKTFAVILNDRGMIGHRTNNLMYRDLTTTTILGNFANTNIPLSGSPVGYLTGFDYNQNVTPNANDTVRMEIMSGFELPSDIKFDPALGHRMWYLESNFEYTNETFASKIPYMTQISPITLDNNGVYSGNFTFPNIGTPEYVYMVWDFRTTVTTPPPRPLNTYSISYTNNIPKQPIKLLIGNNGGSPSNVIYDGLYSTDPLTGTSTYLPAVNALVVLAIESAIIKSATCNNVTVTPNAHYASFYNVNGPLVISFITE